MGDTRKTIFNKDGKRIQIVGFHSQVGYSEFRLEGKMKGNDGKWYETFFVRALVNKEGGIGYVVRITYRNPGTCELYKGSTGKICRTDEELLESIPELNQGYLDKLAATILDHKMRK